MLGRITTAVRLCTLHPQPQSQVRILRAAAVSPAFPNQGSIFQQTCSFHSSRRAQGFEEFYDPERKPGEPLHVGRAWTVPDLRRKSFDDLHKLWFILYKERNLLLTAKRRARRALRLVAIEEEGRYTKVKRSMAAIKVVLTERRKIRLMLSAQDAEAAAATEASGETPPSDTSADAMKQT